MDGQRDGWMDRGMDDWIEDGWMNRGMDGWTGVDRQIEEWMDRSGQIDRRMDVWMDGGMDRQQQQIELVMKIQMDEWTEEWMDIWIVVVDGVGNRQTDG